MRSRVTTLIAAWTAALVLLAAQASPVRAESILNFSLNNANSITATGNPTTGVTTLDTTGASQLGTISLLNGASTNITPVFLILSATSVGPAFVGPGNQDEQFFSGSFSITQNANGTGTNYLSGTFSDMSLLFGANHGNGATLTSSDPPATITFTSSVISALSPPSAANFTFTNVTPPLHIVGGVSHPTIGSFLASGSGTFSANTVPEPSTLALGGLGALGLIGYGLRRRKAMGV